MSGWSLAWFLVAVPLLFAGAGWALNDVYRQYEKHKHDDE